MNGILIFAGKYGSTERYASWIGQTCKIPVTGLKHSPRDVSEYEYVVIGSAVYSGKLLMAKWMKRHAFQLADKKLFIFIVGGTPAEETNKIEKIIRDNVSQDIRLQAEMYYLDGDLDVGHLSVPDRFRLMIAGLFIRDRNQKERIRKGFDQVKFSRLCGIIRSICAFTGSKATMEPASSFFEERLN